MLKVKESLKEYVDILMNYNTKLNLVSRKITSEQLEQLINETMLLDRYVSNNIIIDAGSGNGILGIPIALMNKSRTIILVESKKKKSDFLREVKKKMELPNVEIRESSIEEYLERNPDAGNKSKTIIARGFPRLNDFCRFVRQKKIHEAVLITSENKIKKNENDLENVRKKIYNVPLRNDLRILKITRNKNEK